MDNNEENPIAQRLKQYLDESGMTVSQFADKAGISRPTFSQVINGRNKTISDQLLLKIYQNFPDLDILWLMFNKPRGNKTENIETSELQNTLLEHQNQIEQFDSKPNKPTTPQNNEYAADNQSGKINDNFAAEPQWAASMMVGPAEEEPKNVKTTKKEIASIIILYSDNSFDTFTPASKQ